MHVLKAVSLAIAALSTAAFAQAADDDVIIYFDAGCPGADPEARIDPAELEDQKCHPFGGIVKSTQTVLRYTEAYERLVLFADDKCMDETFNLTNTGPNAPGTAKADGHCVSAEPGCGWQSFQYETYR